MRTKFIQAIFALMLAALACNLPVPSEPTPEELATNTSPPEVTNDAPFCGDNICDGPENADICPADCASDEAQLPDASPAAADTEAPATQSAPTAAEREESFTVTNPTSGAQLFVRIFRPPDWNGEENSTLVLVPGGTGFSADFIRPPRNTVLELAVEGYTVVVFDPDGRGQSEGIEDQNGFAQQDGLAAIIRSLEGAAGVDTDRIGLSSFSFGVTMAAGALARHPDLPVRFLMDWEGPANRNDTGGCDADLLGHLTGEVACDDEEFWAEREALTFISELDVPYPRLQSEKDHVQPDNDHAILMVNAAVGGGVPWVRLNELVSDQTFDPAAPPKMLPDSVDGRLSELVAVYALDLFALP